MKRLMSFVLQPSGATAVEYAMVAALIGVAIIVGAGAVGSGLSHKFLSVGSQVAAVPPN
jgi:pilus assembly protein Flp/PilA